MTSSFATLHCPDTIYIDGEGNRYMVRDTLGAGDCALLSLLVNPSFVAPVSSSNELRRAVVSFARGAHREECSTAFALLADRGNTHFEGYLEHVLQPGAWVGTLFYVWTSLAYGCNIRSHFFNEFRETKVESSRDFIHKYFQRDADFFQGTVDVFFHQFKNMTRCKPSMYNHYAALIPVECHGGGLSIFNELVSQQGTPWWRKTEEVNGYDCSDKQPKPTKQKKEMNKGERKEYNKALTYHYLKEQDNGAEVAEQMAIRLETALTKDDDSSVMSAVSSNDHNNDTTEKIASLRTVTTSKVGRTWKQRAVIIFIFLHPRIGQKNLEVTCSLTGVKEQI